MACSETGNVRQSHQQGEGKHINRTHHLLLKLPIISFWILMDLFEFTKTRHFSDFSDSHAWETPLHTMVQLLVHRCFCRQREEGILEKVLSARRGAPVWNVIDVVTAGGFNPGPEGLCQWRIGEVDPSCPGCQIYILGPISPESHRGSLNPQARKGIQPARKGIRYWPVENWTRGGRGERGRMLFAGDGRCSDAHSLHLHGACRWWPQHVIGVIWAVGSIF